MELPMNIQRAVRRYEKIEQDGLTLYPIVVREYDELSVARPALEVMQQSLPVALMRVPLLSALYQMDYEAALAGEIPSGLFSRALLALALSLRLGEGLMIEKRVKQFHIAIERQDPKILKCLRFTDRDGNEKEIRPVQFQTLRQIIAAQNGIRLESDLANPEIVKARQKMSSAGSIKLDANIDDLIAAVSALSGAEEAEIEGWPILKLERRSTSYQRILSYLVCGIGEVNGTSWKGGNPTPHPFFQREDDGSGLFSSVTERGDRGPPKAAREIIAQTQDLL